MSRIRCMNPLSSTTAALFVLAAMLAATGCKSTVNRENTTQAQTASSKSTLVADLVAKGAKSIHSAPRACHEEVHKACILRDAVRDEDLEKLKALLQENPDLVSCGCDGGTPLVLAAEMGHQEVAELLLANGADMNALGYDALYEAINNQHKEMVKLLLASGAAVNPIQAGYRTPLMKAAEWGDVDVIGWLLAAKAQVNAQMDHGYSSLYFAAILDHIEAAQLLIANGAEVNTKAEFPPLHVAASYGHKDMVELLLAHGADVNWRDVKDGQTALHWAAVNDSKDVVELLLAKGADVNAKTNRGETPLEMAVYAGHNAVAALLRQHGGHK